MLTLVSLLLLIGVLIWLRGKGLAEGDHFEAYFDDVNGLREGAPIQMMGIRVGFVDKVIPRILTSIDFKTRRPVKKYRVQVLFTVQKDLPVSVPKGSYLSIEQSGLIGEQFLEITPPRQREVALSLPESASPPPDQGIPVKMYYQSGLLEVGRVESVHAEPKEDHQVKYHLFYRIVRPGTELPEEPVFRLVLNKKRRYELRILPEDGKLASVPEPSAFFTVENPLRMKRFLEIQMESAEALKVTNDKINQLMSDETISTLQSTLKNTEALTARAGGVLDSANALFRTTQGELGRLVSVSEQLAENVSKVSRNVNEIVGDPRLRSELSSTVASLRSASQSMQTLMNDPALRETLLNAQSASINAAELTASLKQTWGSPDMQQRLDRLSNQLDVSLTQLNRVLTTVEQSVDGKDERLKGIVEDTRAAAKNLRTLTDKFNGRFTLFKLLF